MTDNQDTLDKLEKSAEKERILEAIFVITQSVLDRHSHYEVIPDGLAEIGKAIQADRVYYWENRTEETSGTQLTSQVFEWCRPGASQQIDNHNLRDLPFDIVFDFLEPLKRGVEQSIIVSELEPSFSQKLLVEQEILSLLVLPVMVNGIFWGFVGFDDCGSEKYWSDLEISLLKSFVSILAKSIERNLLEESLIRTKHEAEAASRAKSHFLSNISHELRTPLNAIMVYTDMLKEANIYSQYSGQIDQIGNSAELLLALINNLLDFSKLESGKAELSRRKFYLRDIVRLAVEQSKAAAMTKDITIDCSIDDLIPEALCGDSLKISQILLNLLDNAIKFTPIGQIELTASMVEDNDKNLTVQFSVSDTGIGMTSDQAENIFEPFRQASPEISSNYGGTGLGLAICKNLAELHGGEIWLTSQPGEGTTVSFTAVFCKTCANNEQSSWPARRESNTDDRDTQGNTTVDANSKNILKGIKIIAVEDNQINRRVLETLLADTGAALTLASSGAEALEIAASSQFDLVLMDIVLPEIDGYETTRRLRKLSDYSVVPVIAVTAGEPGIEKQKCRKNQIDALISKPLRKSELVSQIVTCLNGSLRQSLVGKLIEADTNYLEALDRFSQDWQFYCELLSQFHHDYVNLLDFIKSELNKPDANREKLRRRLHSLKGAASELGAVSIANDAGMLESILKMEDINSFGKRFEEESSDFRQRLQKLLEAAEFCLLEM